MGRVFDAVANGKNPLKIPAPVIARYSEDKSNKVQMLSLLKEWVLDTSCATISYSEHHKTISETYSSKEHIRLTRIELDIRYKSAAHPDNKQFVDFLVKTSKWFPHPDYPKRREMRQYVILDSIRQGKRHATRTETDVDTHGQIADAEAASVLMEKHERSTALVGQWLGETAEQTSGAEGAGKKRVTKVLTPEQLAAKEEKEAIRVQVAKAKKIQREVDSWKSKISDSKAKLASLPDAGSGVSAQISVLAEFEPQLKEIFQLANTIIVEHHFEDTDRCQNQLTDISEKVKTELQVAAARVQRMGGNKPKAKVELESDADDADEEAGVGITAPA